jgi:PAS domain-containing protein
MAHHLKLKVVAEGVETPEQLALLISHQCDVIQGYFFSRPMPAPGMTELLVKDKRLPDNLLRSGTRKPMALFVAVDGFEEVISMLVRAGHRVCTAPDIQGALQWFTGDLVDVLVCGAPHKGFNVAELINQAVQMQPRCERILLADSKQWNRKPVAELSSSGLVHRVIHLPVEAEAFQQVLEETLSRRHISDEYSRLSHEVEVVERQLVRIEEDRRRLLDENQALQVQERQGYRILQGVLAELPMAVIGVDVSGLVVLANDAAIQAFSPRGLVSGALLDSVLPEVARLADSGSLSIDGVSYLCRRRQLSVDESNVGRLLLLEVIEQ